MQWLKNLCRLCGQSRDICYSIFDVSSGDLEAKIKKCLKFELSPGDLKPKQICAACVKKLDEFSDFIEMCYLNNQKFETWAYSGSTWLIPSSFCDEGIQQQQSVIVSNKQELYKSSAVSVFENLNIGYSLSERDILDFSTTFNNQNRCLDNCFEEYEVTALKAPHYKAQNSLDCIESCIQPEKVEDSFSDTLADGTFKKANIISVHEIQASVQNVVRSEIKTKVKKYYPCPHCEKTFLRRANLNAHIAVHTKNRPFTCSECSKNFAIKAHLTNHQKIHTDIYRCTFCDKTFAVPSKLERHVRTHTNDRPFVCDYINCAKAFADKRNLDSHKETQHTQDKKFGCNICKAFFKTKYRLTSHLRTHQDGPSYVCDLCGKAYRHRTNLVIHLKNHYVCVKCKKRLENRNALAMHMEICSQSIGEKIKDVNTSFIQKIKHSVY